MRWLYLLAIVFVFGSALPANGQENNVFRSHVKEKLQQQETSPPAIVDSKVVPAGYFVEDKSAKTPTDIEDEKKKAQEKRDEVAKEIRVAERELKQEQQKTSQAGGEVTTPVSIHSDEEMRLRLLKQVDVILAQLEQQASSLEDTKKELVERTKELVDVNQGKIGFDKPWSFLILDQLQDELSSQQSKAASVLLNQTITNEDIVQAKQALESKQQQYRQAREIAPAAVVKGAEEDSPRALEVRLATETLAYRKKRLDILKIRAQIHDIQVKIAEKKIQVIRDEANFSEDDLKVKQQEIAKREDELRRRVSSIGRSMEESDSKWLNDRKLQSTGNQYSPRETEEFELRRQERQSLQTLVASLNFRLELLNQNRQAWEHRYQFANSISTADQNIDFEKQAKTNIAQRERDLSNRMLQLGEMRKTVATLETKRNSITDDETASEIRRIIARQEDAIRSRMIVLDEDVAAIQANRLVWEKLLGDIQGDANRYSFAQFCHAGWYHFKNIWNTELTSVDERSITIGKVILALIIFIGGFWIARIFSRRLRGFLTRRLRVDESAAAAFQSLAFYGLIMAFLLGALNFVSIPLTVFTFLGGALAIGVGFGSQNILSNFISGLILLAERPVKVGDLIHMDEFYGNIENIGARSTIVRTGTNLRLIVPNSKFLENSVINLTHGSNDLIRTCVSVGVAYGSPTRKVTKLLKQAAEDHGLVVKNPEPFVIFKEFADNSLNFDLHFWINVNRPLDRMKMESDIRYRIDSLFTESEIVIAFPQRDIHIDTGGPIDVRMIKEAENDNAQALKDVA